MYRYEDPTFESVITTVNLTLNVQVVFNSCTLFFCKLQFFFNNGANFIVHLYIYMKKIIDFELVPDIETGVHVCE